MKDKKKNKNEAVKIKLFAIHGKYPREIKKMLDGALVSHKRGAHQYAMEQYQHILKLEPKNIDALCLYSAIALNYLSDMNLCRQLLTSAQEAAPDSLIVNFRIASLLFAAKDYRNGGMFYQKIIAMQPTNIECLERLGWCYSFLGMHSEAMTTWKKMLPLNSAEQKKATFVLLARTFTNIAPSQYSPHWDELLLNLLSANYIEHDQLGSFSQSLLMLKYKVNADDMPVDLLELTKDKILQGVLISCLAQSVLFEQWLVKIRYEIVAFYQRTKSVVNIRPLLAAMSLRSFYNEFVYQIPAKEAIELKKIKIELSKPQDSEQKIDILALVGMYEPFELTDNEAKLLAKSMPSVYSLLWEKFYYEPLEELQLAESLKTLGNIDDDVSDKVRKQYEVNPYPRWQTITDSGSITFNQFIADQIPTFTLPTVYGLKTPIKILIAGCGTGRQAINRALLFTNSEITAIDITKRSLSYAKRMAKKYKIKNIKFIHSDILDADKLGEKFDYIECSGVLHHMKDPMQGWKVLKGLLNEGGLMNIGLYSKIARKEIIDFRQYLSEKEIITSPENIRKLRYDVIHDQLPVKLNHFKRTPDLASMSGCRDLLFHVSEHQMTIPQIKESLVNLDMKFLRFVKDPILALRKFKKEYPLPLSEENIDNWDDFEQKHNKTFTHMYQFYCTHL